MPFAHLCPIDGVKPRDDDVHSSARDAIPKPPTSMCRAVSRVIRFQFIGGTGRPSPRLGSSASETAFTHLQRFPCDARRSRIGRRNNTTMLTELTKLAVASTAATVIVWLLSLIHSGCVPDHVGDLIRFSPAMPSFPPRCVQIGGRVGSQMHGRTSLSARHHPHPQGE